MKKKCLSGWWVDSWCVFIKCQMIKENSFTLSVLSAFAKHIHFSLALSYFFVEKSITKKYWQYSFFKSFSSRRNGSVFHDSKNPYFRCICKMEYWTCMNLPQCAQLFKTNTWYISYTPDCSHHINHRFDFCSKEQQIANKVVIMVICMWSLVDKNCTGLELSTMYFQ